MVEGAAFHLSIPSSGCCSLLQGQTLAPPTASVDAGCMAVEMQLTSNSRTLRAEVRTSLGN